jgi:drug/metabolite transporter (DMT)-like permease
MHLAAYGLLFLSTLFWGGNGVAGKLAVGHVSPMLLTAARWGFACAILLALGHARLRADWPALRRRLGLLSLLGFLGFSAFNLALYSALLFTSAINTSIEQAGIALLIFVFNFVLFRVLASAAQIAGFLLSLVGVALTAGHGDLRRVLALDVNFGDALMLVSVIGYAAYTVALRLRPPAHWMSLMIVMTAAAFLTSLPFAAGEFAYGAGVAPDARGWAAIAYTALFPSILSQVFFIRGVEMIGPNRAGLFINLVPICGTLLAIALLGEAFEPFHAAALALVAGGIALAEWGGRTGR